MRAARIRRPAGLLLLALAAACGDGDAPKAPIPLSVTPSQAPGTAPVPVEIAGVGFTADVQTDYGDGSGSTMDARFQARLLPWDGGAAVDLAPVAMTPRRTLTGTVPAGLAPGHFDLVVVDPGGRSGTLPDAYRVVSADSDAVAFRIDPVPAQRAGVPFAVSIAAVDGAGRVVAAYAGTVIVQDATGTVSPTSAGPLSSGRTTAQVSIGVPQAPNRLTIDDGNGRSGTSNDFDVGPAEPARVDFVAAVSASASACSAPFELELRTASGQPAPATGAVTVALQSGPPGALSFFSDASCSNAAASLVLPAGTTRGAFHVRGAAPGTASLRAVPDLLPSVEMSVTVAP